MKKLFVIIAAVAFTAFISACKTYEKCPAYGKADSQKTEKAG